MERLTFNPCDECGYSYSKNNQESNTCKICEFKRMLDLDRKGLLLKLPCKVGDYIWDNDFGMPYGYEVTGFSFGDLNEDYCEDEAIAFDQVIVHYTNSNGSITGRFAVSEIGKTIFLTRAEAEEALQKLNGMKG